MTGKHTSHGIPASPTQPALGLVRIMKGSYPDLPVIGRTSGAAVDIGCGDGANTEFLSSLGWDAFGVEIDRFHVAELTKYQPSTYMVGRCEELPFPDHAFGLAIAWHSCYYMTDEHDSLSEHLSEISRVLDPRGTVILSIPMPSNFIYRYSSQLPARVERLSGIDYVTVTQDPFEIRNGTTLARVADLETFLDSVASIFGWQAHLGEEMGNWFGLRYDWWDIVLQRASQDGCPDSAK